MMDVYMSPYLGFLLIFKKIITRLAMLPHGLDTNVTQLLASQPVK